MTRRRINVIYADNGSGLSRDAMVVREALELAGHRVWLTPLAPRRFPIAVNYAPELARQLVRSATHGPVRAWAKRSRFWDVNIFLERLVPEYLECARINCLFPNQEWLTDEDRGRLGDIDMVLFKTRHAMSILEAEARSSAFVGFSSPDRRDPAANARWDMALHVGGWNPHKGTAAVFDAWSQHPDWPQLTIVSQLPMSMPGYRNIQQLATRITNRRMGRLQNGCAIHVCPSEVEGFGHTLMEALSCGAVIVTTDAPPMNELVSPDEGFLVPHVGTAALGASTRFLVDREHLAHVLARVWRDGAAGVRARRDAARARYERTRASFQTRFAQLLREI
ncbi:MAG: glycosyltransferase family 1 protein [Acidobacteria bacterium]|nr:glycosyltransferase family 1 protein [Acidobacteriota bacterium]